MNIKSFFLVSMILTSLFCFSNVVSAYSLDDFSKEYPSCVLILKSSQTYIAHQGNVYVLDAQNAGLAKGGSGDILCGIVVAMLGQCKDPMQAALCATYLHSQSAKLDIDLASFMPEDIINNIPNTLKRLRS